MSKFVEKNIEAIEGKQQFKQLVVLPNDTVLSKIDIQIQKGQFDLYEESLESSYKHSLNRLISIMNKVANLGSLPETQWKDVTPANEGVKEYEVKAGDLRMFVIKIKNGKLVMLGGYKNNQKEDFRKFRSLKAQYLTSLQNE